MCCACLYLKGLRRAAVAATTRSNFESSSPIAISGSHTPTMPSAHPSEPTNLAKAC